MTIKLSPSITMFLRPRKIATLIPSLSARVAAIMAKEQLIDGNQPSNATRRSIKKVPNKNRK